MDPSKQSRDRAGATRLFLPVGDTLKGMAHTLESLLPILRAYRNRLDRMIAEGEELRALEVEANDEPRKAGVLCTSGERRG